MPKQQVEPLQGSYTTAAGTTFAGVKAYNLVSLTGDGNAALVADVDSITIDSPAIDPVTLYAGSDFAIGATPTITLNNLAAAIAADPVLSLLVAAENVSHNYTRLLLLAVDEGIAGNSITLAQAGGNFVRRYSNFVGGVDAVAAGNAGTNCYLRGRDGGIDLASSDSAVVSSPDSYLYGATFSQILSGSGNSLSGDQNTISGSTDSHIQGGEYNGIYNSHNCNIYGDSNGYCTMIGCYQCDYLYYAWADMMIGGFCNVNSSNYGWNIQMNAESCFLGINTYGCAVLGLKHYVDAEYQQIGGQYGVGNEQNAKKIFAGGSAACKNQEGMVIGSAAEAGGAIPVYITRTLPNNSKATHALMGFTVIMKAIQTGGSAGTVGDMAVRRYVGLVKMDNTDTITLVSSSLDKNLGESAGAAAWGLTFAANAAGLEITTVGEADKVITFGVEVTTHELSV